MNKLLLAFIFMVPALVSCSNQGNPSGADSSTDCLVGTWNYVENNFTKSFTFNANKSGVEVQAADDIRDFTWSIKNGQPVIVYDGESNEWELDLDCESNELEVFLAVYKKQ